MENSAYDKRELRAIIQAFKAMDVNAVEAAKREAGQLVQMLTDKIKTAASTRRKAGSGSQRVAEGVRISKTSKIGEFSYGFASQKFSGGGTTKELAWGLEFGSSKYKQFPRWSGRYGRGSRGYFIYPTLRENQKEIVQQWEQAFDRILKEW